MNKKTYKTIAIIALVVSIIGLVSFVGGIKPVNIGAFVFPLLVSGSGNRKLTPKEKELWLLFDRVYVTELLARDEFAKGAYMLGAEDRETMLR